MKMVRCSLCVASLLLVCSLYALGEEGKASAGVKKPDLDKLVLMLWKDPPPRLELTVYEKVQLRQHSREQLRARIETDYRQMDKAEKATRTEIEFQRAVDEELERELAYEARPHLQKRIATVQGRSFKSTKLALDEEAQGASAPAMNMTYGNYAPEAGEDFYSYEIDHNNKIGAIMKDLWTGPGYDGLGGVSDKTRSSLKVLLGESAKDSDGKRTLDNKGKPFFLPSNSKMEAIIAGETKNRTIEISPEQETADGRTVQVISVQLIRRTGGAMLNRRLTLDARNYDICYLDEVFGAPGKLLYSCEASDFFDLGNGYYYPRNAVITDYNEDGSVGKRREIAVESCVASNVSDYSSFKFSPPADYTCVDHRLASPIVATKDASTLNAIVEELTRTTIVGSAPSTDASRVSPTAHDAGQSVPEPPKSGRQRLRPVMVWIAAAAGGILVIALFIVARRRRRI